MEFEHDQLDASSDASQRVLAMLPIRHPALFYLASLLLCPSSLHGASWSPLCFFGSSTSSLLLNFIRFYPSLVNNHGHSSTVRQSALSLVTRTGPAVSRPNWPSSSTLVVPLSVALSLCVPYILISCATGPRRVDPNGHHHRLSTCSSLTLWTDRVSFGGGGRLL